MSIKQILRNFKKKLLVRVMEILGWAAMEIARSAPLLFTPLVNRDVVENVVFLYTRDLKYIFIMKLVNFSKALHFSQFTWVTVSLLMLDLERSGVEHV